MLTWAICWMIVKTKARVTESLSIDLFVTAIGSSGTVLGTVYMVVELVAKAIG